MGTKRSHKGTGASANRTGGGFTIRILAGGRWRADDPARMLYEEYARRLPWPLELAEFDVRTSDAAKRIATEGVRMLAAAGPPGRLLITLDERGRDFTSAALAEQIRTWQEEGRPALVFAIGGADGLAPAVRSAADLSISFGSMTWPHLMVRAMLAEQLYRANAIITGHPYHRA